MTVGITKNEPCLFRTDFANDARGIESRHNFSVVLAHTPNWDAQDSTGGLIFANA
jgi:hypothetical protein